MVHSGLNETAVELGRTDVASYRLATHLGLAFVILGFLAWFTFQMGRSEADLMQSRRDGNRKLFGMSTGLMHFAFLQIILGALVAGIDAGRAFPTWPLMGDGFLPPEPFTLTPWWRSFFEDAGLVQFIHRMSGYLLMIYAIVVWNRARKSANGKTRFAFNAVLAMMVLQMAIGIVTVLQQAHLHIAITHQIGAVVLWVLILRARYLSRYPLAQSVREA
jgi:cytochrome c oxidase assembly protein subunit 15